MAGKRKRIAQGPKLAFGTRLVAHKTALSSTQGDEGTRSWQAKNKKNNWLEKKQQEFNALFND